jgi:hypothetical protein
MTYIGATTKQIFFYSAATRMYYSFTGDRDITKVDVLNRFNNITAGQWDFVNQEVMFKALLKDQIVVLRLDNAVIGEIYPPNNTVYDLENGGDFKVESMAGGTVFQGPNRFVVNRFVYQDYMQTQIRENMKKWDRLSRYDYDSERDYRWNFIPPEDWNYQSAPSFAVAGWTTSPFKLATAMLGMNEETDCQFEWSLTFTWSEMMESLFKQNEFVCVNLQAETVTQGGTLKSNVTHVYLFKECFNRSGSKGYYTFQYQSNNGIGNRERLYVWSDGIIALEGLQLSCLDMTERRTQPLTIQADVQQLTEQ